MCQLGKIPAAAMTRKIAPKPDAATVDQVKVPGAMARLGTRIPGGLTYDLHQGDLIVDEGAVLVGAQLLAGAALSSFAM